MEEWDFLKAAVAEVKKAQPPDIARALSIRDGKPKKTFLLARGDPDSERDEMPPGVLTVLSRVASPHAPDAAPSPLSPPSRVEPFFSSLPAEGGATRTDLARWLTDVEQGAGPLAARVAVNRVWQHYFGRGLVPTPSDFGVRGDAPTHPELLNWLAGELVLSGWRMKHIHRLILDSAVWRQASSFPQSPRDPEGARLYVGREPLRIEAEILRDSILAVSGSLNRKQFGPAVKPRMNPEAIAITTDTYDHWPKDVTDGPETWRRGIYVFVKRSNLLPFLQTFDSPNAIGSCVRRNPSTVAPQALTLMNDAFVRDQARHFAERLRREAPDATGQCNLAWRLAFGRPPAEAEMQGALRFYEKQQRLHETDSAGDAPLAALTDLCQALFASNESLGANEPHFLICKLG